MSTDLRVRLPDGLHAQLVAYAAEEGVSLNTWIVTLLAGGIGFSLAEPQSEETQMGKDGGMRMSDEEAHLYKAWMHVHTGQRKRPPNHVRWGVPDPARARRVRDEAERDAKRLRGD
jgi:HicB family